MQKTSFQRRVQISLIALFLFTFGLTLFSFWSRHTAVVEISEPDAPLAKDLTISPLELDPALASTIELTNVVAMDISADQQNYLLLSQAPTTEAVTSLIPVVHAQSASDLLTLNIIGQDGKLKAHKENLYNARFSRGEKFYYQQAVNGPGIYEHDLASDQSRLITYTYDGSSFNNVSILADDQFFYIQPATGRIGFADPGKAKPENVLDTKVLPMGNYSRTSAYRYAIASPDKQYIAIYDLTPQVKSQKVQLLILSANSKDINNVYMRVDASLTPRGVEVDYLPLEWSADSKYLVNKDDSTIIDIDEQKVIFTTDGTANLTQLAPNQDRIASVDRDSGAGSIISLSDQQSRVKLPQHVSDLQWLSDQRLLITIGKRLYVMNTQDGQLNAVTEIRDQYQILKARGTTVFVKSAQGIIKVQD